MLKKRVVFTLLYDSGSFMLSRNFRLQRVGDLSWLQTNYDFAQIAFFIDELIVLDVSQENKNIGDFCKTLKQLATGCFAPIAAGGGVRSIEDARRLLHSGADKIVINTPLFKNQILVENLAKEFGEQCLVGSVDVIKNGEEDYTVVTECGNSRLSGPASDSLLMVTKQPIGEIYLNSIDRDGTGQGYDLSLLGLLPKVCTTPIIIAGGVGNAKHLAGGFCDDRVDAVATANLFNFVGNGLQRARALLVKDGFSLATWPPLHNLFQNANFNISQS